MEEPEVEILFIEDDPTDAEKALQILRKNKLANKFIHLRDVKEANDFIFCEGSFSQRNIHNQPKTIIFNMKMPEINDIAFLNKINSDIRTKNISLVVFAEKENEKVNGHNGIKHASSF